MIKCYQNIWQAASADVPFMQRVLLYNGPQLPLGEGFSFLGGSGGGLGQQGPYSGSQDGAAQCSLVMPHLRYKWTPQQQTQSA